LRDTLAGTFRSPLKSLRRTLSAKEETVWALKDVSFKVMPGEVVGIIGRNGAGKSTLLKLLSRITEPTTGRIELYGRVASLLEVGTGFNPELTGRENVYLNGAVLGMKRVEIDRKFDEIVAFAEIEKFLDTPVKHYSSGMYMRLAFAIAAHLEPEILVMDEVLAVGDANFQKKCLNKMQDVGQEGRTVLFVSHDISAVTRLCPRAILLDDGGVLMDGPSDKVTNAYLNSGFGTTAAREWPNLDEAPGNDVARLKAVRLVTEDGRTTDTVDIRRPIGVKIEYQVLKPGLPSALEFRLFDEHGICAFTARDQDRSWRGKARPKGRYVSTSWIPGNLLAEGTFFVAVALTTEVSPVAVHFYELNAVAFQVIDSLDGDSARGDFAGVMPGVVRPLLEWHTQFRPEVQEFSSVTGEKTSPQE
jgi:lipopolysaccharide transport system ATP-binding protein